MESHGATLGRWADGGKIGLVRAHGAGKRLYSAADLDRRAAARLRTKIRNLISTTCNASSLIKWLCESYQVVLLRQFETQRMIGKHDGRRRIHSKTARAMATWAHYRFRTHDCSNTQRPILSMSHRDRPRGLHEQDLRCVRHVAPSTRSKQGVCVSPLPLSSRSRSERRTQHLPTLPHHQSGCA